MANDNTQNLTMMIGGDCHRQTPAADETGHTQPADGGPAGGNAAGGNAAGGNWIYGDPQLTYGGQPASYGVPGYTVAGSNMPGTMMPGGADNVAMPIPNMNGGDTPGGMSIPGLNGGGTPGGMSSSAAQSERMRNPVPMAGTHTPANSTEAYQASLRSLLDRNVGYFVVGTFLIGTGQSVTWQGILHTVGSDYLVLYQPDYERYISCDFYSLKFMQFHNVKGIPYCAASQNWQGQIRY